MSGKLTNNDVRGNPYRIREPNNSSLLEIWLVSAVVTVLVIRLYLYVTGYPQVGGDTLHIAHMLWGGLGMVIAFGMLLLFADSVWKPPAALAGGIGFGAFIDELGKFITKDNDYFFQPTIAIMYAVFIVLFFAARYLDRKREPTEADHLYLAAQGVAWQAIGKLDKRRQKESLANLEASGNTSEFALRLQELLENADLVEESEQSRILALRDRAAGLYWKLVRQKWLLPVVIGLFVIRAVEIVATLVIGIFVTEEYNLGDGLSVFEWLSFAAGAVTGFLAVYGLVMMMRGARVRALQAFATSTIVALFFGQFFAFATHQLAAMVGLVVNLSVLGILRLGLSVENERYNVEGEPESDEDPRAGLGQFL